MVCAQKKNISKSFIIVFFSFNYIKLFETKMNYFGMVDYFKLKINEKKKRRNY
jgi:hypothetical protein